MAVDRHAGRIERDGEPFRPTEVELQARRNPVDIAELGALLSTIIIVDDETGEIDAIGISGTIIADADTEVTDVLGLIFTIGIGAAIETGEDIFVVEASGDRGDLPIHREIDVCILIVVEPVSPPSVPTSTSREPNSSADASVPNTGAAWTSLTAKVRPIAKAP